MNASGAEAETAGAHEKQACRNFIAAIMVSRCGANTLRAMQGAFVGDKPAKILAVYESIVNSKQNEGIEPRLIVPFDGEFNGDEINAAEILEDILNLASR